MNRKSKLLALILTLVLCVSIFSAVRVFAVEDESVDTTPSEVETVETDPPPETDPPVTQTSPPPATQEQNDTPETYDEPETEEYYQEEDNNESNNNDYNYDDEENYDNSGNESYEQRESNTTNEKAETAAVYDAEKDDVSTDTLKKSDWAKIAEQLKNANGDGSDDFAFIRNNDQGGANNGEWMLILGIAMEAVGLGIVIFLIVSKIRMKKAMETNGGKGGRNGKGGSSRPERRSPSGKNEPRQARRSEQNPKAQRATKKQRSKFDTADIELPRHAKKPSSSSRYKPRH